jgi:KTSC domain-containing protein
VDRLVPKPMAVGPTQRVADNAFHLPVFLIQNLSTETRTLKSCEYPRRNSGRFVKGPTVLRIVLSFCISIAVAAVVSAEPSATPSQIISHIPRQPVQSTAIAKIGYSKRRHILEIGFVNGAIYRYLDLSPAVHRDLMSAASKARFYDSNIRRHYRSILVRARQMDQTRN